MVPEHIEKILQDLDEIYSLAMEKGNFAVALKVKELLGREQGLFRLSPRSAEKKKLSLSSLSKEDIVSLIKDLEDRLSLDHPQREE